MTAKNNKQAVSDESKPEANPMDQLIAKHGDIVKHSLNSSELEHKVINKGRHKFQKGNKLAVGQKRGRQKLTNAFVEDLSSEWNKRGQAALAELTGDKLVQACIAILPKDVLVSLNQSDTVTYVINANPMSQDEWANQHGIKTIEHDKDQ